MSYLISHYFIYIMLFLILLVLILFLKIKTTKLFLTYSTILYFSALILYLIFCFFLNNPLKYIDPNGMLVYGVEEFLKEPDPVDENGNPIPEDKMTARQRHISRFKKWWKANGERIMALFGKGGKYEKIDIHFIMGVQPGHGPRFNNYDVLTTWGNQFMEDEDYFRGGSSVKLDDEFGIGPNYQKQPIFKIYFNPNRYEDQDDVGQYSDAPTEEWNHVKLIFNYIQNRWTVPNGSNQHIKFNTHKYQIK